MDSQSMVYRLLARGLLEIRVASIQGDSKVAFHLADLLHNVPLQMERVRHDGGDYSEMLGWLRMRAEQKSLSRWLDGALLAADVAAPVLLDQPDGVAPK